MTRAKDLHPAFRHNHYLFRRKVFKLFDGGEVAQIRQHFNPFVLKYSMTIVGPGPSIDRRLLISSGILLAGIEWRQR